MSLNPGSIRIASIAILKERHREQESKQTRETVYAVYANATPTPDDAHPAVKITEEVFKAHTIAVAKFHEQEAARFKAALEAAEATL